MRSHRPIFVAAVLISLAWVWLRGGFIGVFGTAAASSVAAGQSGTDAKTKLQKATFAAGCFWCVESDFDKVKGVVSTTSGYTGGHVANPTYEQVSRGGTGHVESVEIVFDPAVVSYDELLAHYWKNVDPFNANRQFCDVGDQYRPEIFVHDAAQRAAAEASRKRVQARFRERIVVRITDAQPFYRAEEYHQDYYRKNPLQYRFYRWSCGRDARLEQIAAAATGT